jgi:hypothetical protein
VITIRPCVAGNKSWPAQEAPGSRTRMIKATAMPATSTRARSSRPSVFNVIGRSIYPSEALKSVTLRTNQPISPLRVEEDFSAPILEMEVPRLRLLISDVSVLIWTRQLHSYISSMPNTDR